MKGKNFNNFVSIVNSAIVNRQLYIDVEFSYFVLEILRILRNYGQIKGFLKLDNRIRVFFRYVNNTPVLKKISVISKSKRRVYRKLNNVYSKSFNLKLNGFYILSTSFGLYTDYEVLFLNKFVSGEVVLFVHI